MPSSTPIYHWIGFHLFLLTLLATELLFSRRRLPTLPQAGIAAALARRQHRTAVAATVLWIAAALAFALFVHHALGAQAAVQYLAGYSIEEALSIDNLFVFLLLFRLFKIESRLQPRVLFWGVAGAILMRGLFIAGGLSLLARFAWISYLFAVILLIAAVRLLIPENQKEEQASPRWVAWLSRIHPVSLRQDRFFTTEIPTGPGFEHHTRPQRMVTMLFLCLVAIELTDVVFALDSIPAVLSITRHPFLAYTSNIMAVMGLRSLFFLLVELLQRLRFLHYGLAAVLAFAALKMLIAPWVEIGPLTSLAAILGLLGVTIAASVFLKPKPNSKPTTGSS